MKNVKPPFAAEYAAFLAYVARSKETGDYVIAEVRSVPDYTEENEDAEENETRIYEHGLPGGKEEALDKKRALRTLRREVFQELGLKTRRKPKMFFKKIRVNNEDKNKSFTNYYFLFLDKRTVSDSSLRISNTGGAKIGRWITLCQFDRLMLKPSHRLAHIELCYTLERLALDENNAKLVYDLRDCLFNCFEQPSKVNDSIMWKSTLGSSGPYVKRVQDLLGEEKFSQIFEGLKITPNPLNFNA